MKRTSSSRRQRITAAFGVAALVALTGSAGALVNLDGEADGLVSVPGALAGADVDAEVEIDEPDLDAVDLLDALDLLDELDLDDLDLEELDLDLDDLELAEPGDGDGPDLEELLELDIDDLFDGELGPLVEVGRVFVENTTVSFGNNILREAEILNDLDIQVGDEDTLDEVLGLAGLLPGLGGGNGGGDDDSDDDDSHDDDDAEVEGAGALNTVKPRATAKPASGPDLVAATTLERPATADAPPVEVAGDEETAAPRRGPMPRTGGSGAPTGLAVALLAGSGAIGMMLRRRRGER